jgi:Tectonin domain
VDANGLIYKRRVNELDYPGDVWTQVQGPGPAVNEVYVGGNSKIVWAVSGSNIYYTPKASISWTQVANPYGITQLSVGSQEVWGVNAAGTLYRRSISGAGGWDAVDGTMTRIAVGENYAWGLSGSTPYSRRLTGFLGYATASIPSIPTGVAVTAANSSDSLSWATSASMQAATATALGYPSNDRQHPAQKEQIANPHGLHIGTERGRRLRERDAEVL